MPLSFYINIQYCKKSLISSLFYHPLQHSIVTIYLAIRWMNHKHHHQIILIINNKTITITINIIIISP